MDHFTGIELAKVQGRITTLQECINNGSASSKADFICAFGAGLTSLIHNFALLDDSKILPIREEKLSQVYKDIQLGALPSLTGLALTSVEHHSIKNELDSLIQRNPAIKSEVIVYKRAVLQPRLKEQW